MGKMQEALRKAQETRSRKAPAAAEREGAAPAARSAGGAGVTTSAALTSTARAGDVDPRLVALSAPTSETAEQYRTLKANLLGLSAEAPPKVFAVTGAAPGDGKTVTAVNLACSLAEETGRRVVVIDADMRRPSVHKLLGIDNQRGLADYLSGGTMIEMVLQRSRLPNLWAVPAGRVPPNPAELLGGKGMGDLLARLRRDYDFVVVDTPSVVSSPDAAVLSPRIDVTLVAVRMGETPRGAVRDAVETLRRADATYVAAVLTGVEI
jgi:capsular exopolysaccharide synthesis family protein